MSIKKCIVPGVLVVSMLGAGLSNATPSMQPGSQAGPNAPYHHMRGKLTDTQRQQLKSIKKNLREQLRPLAQQERELQTQLRGKLVAQGTSSSYITNLVDKLNTVRGQMFSAITQAQLQAYQKTGVLLPMHHGKHHAPGHAMRAPE